MQGQGQKSAVAVRRLPKPQSRDAALPRDGAVQYVMRKRRRGACGFDCKRRDGAVGGLAAQWSKVGAGETAPEGNQVGN